MSDKAYRLDVHPFASIAMHSTVTKSGSVLKVAEIDLIQMRNVGADS